MKPVLDDIAVDILRQYPWNQFWMTLLSIYYVRTH